MRLDVVAGDLRTKQQAACVRRHGKVDQTRFAHGVDHHDVAAAPPQQHQLPHKARVVRGGVAADEEYGITLGKIVEDNRRRARAERAADSDPACLMTVVAAVVDVVGAVEASEQL